MYDIDRERFLQKLQIVALVATALWFGIFCIVGPVLISASYHGEGIAALNRFFSVRQHHALHAYLYRWQILAWGGFATWGLLVVLCWVCRYTRLPYRWIAPATPGTLGAMRCLVTGTLLILTLWEDLPGVARLPAEFFHTFSSDKMGLVTFLAGLPGFAGLAQSNVALSLLKYGTAAFLTLGLMGWKTRWVLPVAAVGLLLQGGLLRHLSHFYHAGMVAFYVLVVLCFTRCGDGFSLDRLLRLAQGRDVPPADTATGYYGGARFLCWLPMILVYFLAGTSKLINGGWQWWEPDNVRAFLFADSLNPMDVDINLGLWLGTGPDWLVATVGLFALCTEMCFGLVLWGRPWRTVMPLAALSMHVGILLFQNILFLDMLLLQSLYVDCRMVRQRVAARLGKCGKRPLLYDGSCSLAPVVGMASLGGLVCERVAGGGRPSPPPNRADVCQPTLVPTIHTGRLTPAAFRHLILLAVTIYLVFLCFAWTRLEFYPFSSWQMYAYKAGKTVHYYKTFADYSNGDRRPFVFGADIGLLRDARVLDHLPLLFSPVYAAREHKLLQVVIDLWNQRHGEGGRIVALEVEKWQWAFRAEPDSVTYGAMMDRRRIEPAGKTKRWVSYEP